jgi:hypothetical protein
MSTRITAMLVFAVITAAAPARAQQTSRAPQSRPVTIVGDVIDVSCKLGQGLSGADHRMCAQVCADRNIPLAILGTDGNVYLPISQAMPGDAQNARLREHAENRVRVTGRVVNQNGARGIFIETVTAVAAR